jgi:hypothetical protein
MISLSFGNEQNSEAEPAFGYLHELLALQL